jgi:hypothetical protein
MRTKPVIEMLHVPWRRARTEPVSLPHVARTATAPDSAVPQSTDGRHDVERLEGEEPDAASADVSHGFRRAEI